MGRYRGDGCVSRHLRDCDDPATCLRVQMDRCQVNYFTKIMEAYSHLVFISPVNSREGIVALYATPDNMPEVKNIVSNFPVPVKIVD